MRENTFKIIIKLQDLKTNKCKLFYSLPKIYYFPLRLCNVDNENFTKELAEIIWKKK